MQVGKLKNFDNKKELNSSQQTEPPRARRWNKFSRALTEREAQSQREQQTNDAVRYFLFLKAAAAAAQLGRLKNV